MLQGFKYEIHPNTISGWIRKCVLECYSLRGRQAPTSAASHEVRRLGASLASLRNVGLSDILDACYWRAPNTFISHYLRDLTEVEGELMRLGKLSVQHLV